MRILIATDAFPPVSGGSGWSTYELARGLRARGHDVSIVQPFDDRKPGPYDGFDVEGFRIGAPRVPFVRNYFRNERLYDRLSEAIARTIRERGIDIVHAQHELTGPAAVRAAKAAGVPVVCTVRDYWPLCYWSDLVRQPQAGATCPVCSAGGMAECLRPRAGAAWPAALPLIPYMQSNLRTKQRDLASADVVVAVSHFVSDVLRSRADFSRTRIEVLPNGVAVDEVQAHVQSQPAPLEGGYAVFVGKLAANKGAGALIDVVERARLGIPLVIIGDGPERTALEAAASRSNMDVRFMKWLDRGDVFRWLGHARLLLFPSRWPEPLSRVLIEASALGVPIAAMNTGGTPDVVVDEETGLLSASSAELAEDAARIAADPVLRARLGAAAAARAKARFDVPVVVERFERLYRELV